MTHYNQSDVIDLTDSFILADHCTLSDVIIELDTDDSFNKSCLSSNINEDLRERKTSSTPKKKKKPLSQNNESCTSRTCNKFGNCPICWEELGLNPLASTKCGHVYCLKCLEQYLHVERKCPTCRRTLKGASAYHPLYLTKH